MASWQRRVRAMDPRPAMGVVMAAANYPDTPRTGDVIHGLDAFVPQFSKVSCGTRQKAQPSLPLAAGCSVPARWRIGRRRAASRYAAVAPISWDGEFHRIDIVCVAVARERG